MPKAGGPLSFFLGGGEILFSAVQQAEMRPPNKNWKKGRKWGSGEKATPRNLRKNGGGKKKRPDFNLLIGAACSGIKVQALR